MSKFLLRFLLVHDPLIISFPYWNNWKQILCLPIDIPAHYRLLYFDHNNLTRLTFKRFYYEAGLHSASSVDYSNAIFKYVSFYAVHGFPVQVGTRQLEIFVKYILNGM